MQSQWLSMESVTQVACVASVSASDGRITRLETLATQAIMQVAARRATHEQKSLDNDVTTKQRG